MTYVRAGGWLEQVGSTMLTQLLRENPDEGKRLVRRISAALASPEHQEAVLAMKGAK